MPATFTDCPAADDYEALDVIVDINCKTGPHVVVRMSVVGDAELEAAIERSAPDWTIEPGTAEQLGPDLVRHRLVRL